MHIDDIDVSGLRYDGSRTLQLASCPNQVEPFYDSKKEYKQLLVEYSEQIDQLQNKMYAHDRYGMLIVFQAMDAAGQERTICPVISRGHSPGGVGSAF